MNRCRVAFVALLAVAVHVASAAETLIFDQPQVAGISGFREFWDTPVVLAGDGPVGRTPTSSTCQSLSRWIIGEAWGWRSARVNILASLFPASPVSAFATEPFRNRSLEVPAFAPAPGNSERVN